MVVNRGGMANYTRVAAGGSVIVGYGGTASRTTINGSNHPEYTTMTVYSGGKAIGVTMSDARMLVEGTASNVTLQNAPAAVLRI